MSLTGLFKEKDERTPPPSDAQCQNRNGAEERLGECRDPTTEMTENKFVGSRVKVRVFSFIYSTPNMFIFPIRLWIPI